MARLEAIARALYYPTPDRVVGMIADVVRLTGSGAALLDPCAGEGRAAAEFARRWGVVAHGIELHEERADAAADVLSWARHGSYHQLSTRSARGAALDPDAHSPAPEARPFGVLFLNPPYDDGADEHGASLRQEIEFLRATTRFLAPGGLLVFVPPRRILRSEVFREFLRRNYTDIRAYAFPEPEVDAFDQVVVIARRNRGGWQSYADMSTIEAVDHGALPPLDLAEPYEISVPIVAARLSLVGRAPETYAPAEGEGAWASPQWLAHTGEGAEHEFAPLVAPRAGHQAMLLAAGELNGLELNGFLVKGGSRKVINVVRGEGETVHREQIASYLSVLDLKTGELDSWQVADDQAKTAAWFEKHGDELAAGILSAHAPQFGPREFASYDFTGLRAPGILPGRTEPELLQVQREAAAAVVHRWYGGSRPSRRRRGHKGVIICGEMGTGKTTMAVLAAELARAKKVIVVCPTHLVKKWVREIDAITGRRGAATIAKRIADVDAFFASSRASYLVLSKETAKLGARWSPARARGSRVVEREVRRAESAWSSRTVTEMVRVRRKFDACPACGAEVLIDPKVQCHCATCLEPLYQYGPITAKGTKRWPLAGYIRDRYARRYTLVVDEAHQHAAGETDQARAGHQLITGARKVLMMTGTIYGGRASSIFHLLYRLIPAFRRAYKITDCAAFVAHHGLFETAYKEEDERTSTYGYKKGNTGGRIREIPGMSPAMIPLILPFTVFVKLRDLRLELPEYTEEVRLIEPDPRVLAAASKFQGELKKLLREHPRAIGAYLQACLGYPDRPDQREEVYDVNEDGGRGPLLATMEAIEGSLWPKDEALVEIAREERAAGRKVLVFFSQTQRRDARPRVRAALEAAGLRVVQLDSSVAPEKREEWMAAQCRAGFDVMLTNGKLVETGLDLLWANTIVQYGVEYSINTLRQSIRRSLRLGQCLPVRVVFLAYRGTMQAAATELVAQKTRAAELVDGDASGGLAQFDGGGGNFLLELAHEVISRATLGERRATDNRQDRAARSARC